MGSIPSGLTTLSVSLIHGRFHAVAVSRGTVTASWDAPGLVNEPSELASAIKQAVLATGYGGSTVRMVLAHSRLVSSLSPMPPAKGTSLQRVLERVAQRDKTFEGAAVWCHQLTPAGKTGPNALLHLFPATLLEQYSRACEKGAGLSLVSVVPAGAVLHGQILELSVSTEDAVMMVAGLGSSSILLVGQRDGQVLIARSVPSSWTGNVAGLLSDLSSTVMYTKEQFSTEVSGIYLFGAEAVLHQAALQAPFDIPVRPAQADDVPGYWATEVLRLPPAMTPNLVSVAQQKAPQRRVMVRVVASLAMVLVVVALGMLAWSHLQLNKLGVELTDLQGERDGLTVRHKEFSKSCLELMNQRELGDGVVERLDPIPLWGLGYLTEVVPEKLLLTEFGIVQQGPVWQTHYAGVLLPTTDPAPDLVLAEQVAAFTNRLAGPPMHMLVTNAATFQGSQRMQPTEASVFDDIIGQLQPQSTNRAGVPVITHGFVVEGLVR
jgi:hypothetical protein